MISGEKYDATDRDLSALLQATRQLIWQYNFLPPDKEEERQDILQELLGTMGKNPRINAPFRCDYGCNIHIGRNFFSNFNLTILDEAPVSIGDNVLMGPNVSIYTACHPIEPAERNHLIEWARPVTIGDSVWIGGSVTILPGVIVGSECTIGAGAVVTHSVPARCVVAGNPARVIRALPPESPQQLGLDSCAG